jgi:uncharacterized protein (DUF1501 family)
MNFNCCEGTRPTKFSRRYFMKQGGIALAGLSTMPGFLQRAIASTPSAGKKQLVVLFQRGAADGLNIVVPHGEAQYYSMRPSINIPRKAVLDLNGFFGLMFDNLTERYSGTFSIIQGALDRTEGVHVL